MELTPLRDFVNKKLKALQERLKALAAMKKDQEAAGTKTKILRQVVTSLVGVRKEHSFAPICAFEPPPLAISCLHISDSTFLQKCKLYILRQRCRYES